MFVLVLHVQDACKDRDTNVSNSGSRMSQAKSGIDFLKKLVKDIRDI